MDDKTLFRIALISSLVGIFLLFYVTEVMDNQVYETNKVKTELKVKDQVRFDGFVKGFKTSDNFFVFNLIYPGGMVKVVGSGKLNLNNNENITVFGLVKEYDGQLEVIADKIVRI